MQIRKIPHANGVVSGSGHQGMFLQLHAFDIITMTGQLAQALECRQIPDTSGAVFRGRDHGSVGSVQIETGDDSIVSVEGLHTRSRISGLTPVLQLKFYWEVFNVDDGLVNITQNSIILVLKLKLDW